MRPVPVLAQQALELLELHTITRHEMMHFEPTKFIGLFVRNRIVALMFLEEEALPSSLLEAALVN